MRGFGKEFAIVALLLALVAPVNAQHALVLSGGGARGLAHAGSLVALEELGYDMPVVVGTSMGAIVGALYAAGYEAAEIRRIISEENWLGSFAGVPLAIGPDRLAGRPLLGVGLGSRRLPEGALSTTGVNQRLVELLFEAGARARNDFDRLPRRFRAVTTDFATGAEFVIGAGDLPRAVRASMAVPGAFAPVPWDGRILVDGGVANNLPVSVARGLTDLPVIAIDVLRPAPDIPERYALDVGVRGLRLLIENAQPAVAPPPELLVLPSIGPGFSEARFPADPSQLLEAGYDAVRAQLPPRHEGGQRRPAGPAGPAVPVISSIVVEGGDAALRRLVARVLQPCVGRCDTAGILHRTGGLYHTGLFYAVWPRLEFADEGTGAETTTLVIDVQPVNRTSVAGAARWDNDAGGRMWGSLRHLLSLHWPVELRASVRLGELSRGAAVEASLFSTLLPGVTWTGGGHGSEYRVRTFDRDTVTALQPVHRGGGWIGGEYHGDWRVSVLGRADYVDDEERNVAGWTAGPHLRLARLPPPEAVTGEAPLLEVEARFGQIRYHRAHARAGLAARLGKLRLATFLDLVDAGSEAPRDVLPAATRELAPWLPAGALRGHSRAVAALDLAWPLVLDGYVRTRIRGYGAADQAALLDDRRRWRAGGDVGVVWPTVVGMLETGVARGAGGWRFNIGIGPRFQ
ncbi:hypothetical protein BH23GEM9_BH23GEM9_37240 [soil metagenome]